MTDRMATPDPIRGALVGLVAGLAASLAMNQFQAIVQSLSSKNDSGGEPATDKAADRLAIAATGHALPDADKPLAGNVVHYAFGAALGVAYGVAAEYRPGITSGYGTAFGTGVAALMDETAVPAAGLAPAPTETPPVTHVYALVSHLVFGAVAEASRRVLRRAF